MDLLELLLNGKSLLVLAGLVAFVLLLRTLTSFLGEAAELRIRLQSVQQELDRTRADLPEKKTRVEKVLLLIQPLKDELQKMQLYYSRLKDLERKAEEKEKKKEAPSDEIKIHRPGLPEL